MVRDRVKISNKLGIPAQLAAKLVDKAIEYNSDIKIIYNDQEVNAKDMMEVMGLEVNQEAEILVRADGQDESKAVKSIVGMVEEGAGDLM
ncbi:HPr family phosphocarrier protein [Halanaerobacter jeridensis]|uniref:Phosphotransferase system HPr (HPr) family protein n=1 Tax=Halanaerobacter jeridensis TaxID=706427 RepID=A0A939BQA1_9FIRM|nr:HPr family phosphocarrier protein [Halanaerobacter jeridensis]MBM7556074.1 phosphotransferase system HPr (HPr) family protein [Halanaerobacter jeridensis]